MDNRLHDDWEELFDRLPVDATARDEHRERLRSQVLDAYEDRPTPRSQRLRLNEIGRTLMRYKAPHWTAAAVLVACLIWLLQNGTTPAFAVDEVVDNMVKARSARYDMTAKALGQPAQKMKAFYLAPGHFRQELENGYVNIADWQVGKVVGLDSNSMRATVFKLVNVPKDAKSKMQMNQFEMVRESLRKAIDDPDSKVESLGEKEFDGRKLVGFHFKTGPQKVTVWADPQTKFPVRIETTMTGPPQVEIVMTNYEFNIDLDKSLFSVEIPEGYKATTTDVDASPPTEAEFIASLRMCVKTNDGEFPAGLDPAAVAKYAAVYVQKLGIDKDKGITSEQMKKVTRLGRGLRFALTLPVESDAHYAGNGVEQGDTKRAVFWYKPTDAKKYRVIYADFSMKELDGAPDVPGAKKLAL